jgi:serine/threonine-protein kinase
VPHLTSDKQFRAMFLDEARIAAGIRSPNVVQVTELGQDGDDLFLVMEYLSCDPPPSRPRRRRRRYARSNASSERGSADATSLARCR